jgi:hypothetical protein
MKISKATQRKIDELRNLAALPYEPPKSREQMIDEICLAFFKSCRPFTPAEEIVFACEQALKDMADESRPEHARFNSAIRLLCSIKAIGDRLPVSALNEIYGREGIMQASGV